MKIVHVAPNTPYNDYWGYQDNLLPKYQAKQGHDVAIITTNMSHKDGKIVEVSCGDYVLQDGVRVIRVKRKKYVSRILENLCSYMPVYDLLCDLQPDFVFYQRPYEHYLPEKYHTSPVSRYAKTCYIPYFLPDTKLGKAYYKTNFFRYLSCFFCGSKEQQKEAETASARKNIFLGYPAAEGIEIDECDISRKNILYTPRWAEDTEFGGTSFYGFKDSFLQLGSDLGLQDSNGLRGADGFAQSESDLGPQDSNDPQEAVKNAESNCPKICFRPHPLLFQTAVRTERMTEDEVAEYKQRLKTAGIVMDTNSDYMETFKETGILVTDLSSIILNFFFTGKPVIICRPLKDVVFSDTYEKMFKCIYRAETWENVVSIIKELRKGNDPLKEERLRCIEKISGGGGSAEKIKEYLKQQASAGHFRQKTSENEFFLGRSGQGSHKKAVEDILIK